MRNKHLYLLKKSPAASGITKLGLLGLVVLLAGCGGLGTSSGYTMRYAHNNNPTLQYANMPSEGWATDPTLSYNLYSYYPVNYYNTGFYRQYGIHGIYYHL